MDLRRTPPHVSDEPQAKKPKGILKNAVAGSPILHPQPVSAIDRDAVVHNTQLNAGRHGSQSDVSHDRNSEDSNVARLKWDEANLYLTEQEKTSKMKITEPKTPFPPQYNPEEDEDNDGCDVPDLDLGPAEEEPPVVDPSRQVRRESQSPKQVVVDDENIEDGAEGSSDDEERHKRFAELRKKHYEMKDAIKLGHQLDALEDLDDDEGDREGQSVVSYNGDGDDEEDHDHNLNPSANGG